MKRAVKIFSSILAIGAVIASIFAATPYVLGQNAHKLVDTSSVPLMHVKKESILGTSSATLTHVPEVGKASRMNRLPASEQGFYQNKVVIVTFHDISPRIYSPYVITPDQFSADIAILGRDFHVITNTEFINFLNHKGSVPENAVLLTFDDGYQGMYSYALPILLAHHMSGTFFDIVSSADNNRPDYLTWEEMRMMEREGMSIESHTYASHYEVRDGKKRDLIPVFNTRIIVHGERETIFQYHQRVLTDFSKAKSELEMRLNVPIVQFAWPYGWGSPFASYIAREAGYKYLYTTADGCVTSHTNIHRIPRIDIGKPFITPNDAVNMVLETANGGWHQEKHMNNL